MSRIDRQEERRHCATHSPDPAAQDIETFLSDSDIVHSANKVEDCDDGKQQSCEARAGAPSKRKIVHCISSKTNRRLSHLGTPRLIVEQRCLGGCFHHISHFIERQDNCHLRIRTGQQRSQSGSLGWPK